MSQDQQFSSQATMTTECPVCGVHAWVEAPTCPACGTALRAVDPDDLFTTVAVDNAEVVPTEPAATRDQLWTVSPEPAPEPAPEPSSARLPDLLDEVEVVEAEVVDAEVVEESHEGSAVDEELFDDDLWEAAEPVAAPLGGFSPAPADRSRDVLDAEEIADDDLWVTTATTPERGAAPDRPLFVAPRASGVAPSTNTATAAVPTGAQPDAGQQEDLGLWDSVEESGARTAAGQAGSASPSDPHGLAGALARISPEVVDRAAVPLAVVSVLLEDDEVVEAAVVGEMLGHPAAVVVSGRRAVVANGRRWTPVVDIFEVDDGLDVRGRHDGGVAALTLMDADRIVTVDGIADVPLAMHFADLVRSRTRR